MAGYATLTRPTMSQPSIPMTVLTALLHALRDAAAYNSHELAAPRVILWPDEAREWTPCIEALRASHPTLWSLGDYAPKTATGPAVWLRYQLETHASTAVPVIYLPGIGRPAFRSAAQCPKPAQHLFALQFQGQFWTQNNGKDWTPCAFLASAAGGLGLDVATDPDTQKALQESLRALLDMEVATLRGRKLEAADFRALVTKDPVRTLLRWMGDPARIQQELERAGSEWASFRAVCRDSYGFDPEKDGVLTAAEKLTQGKTAWSLVWERYKEAPRAYPGIQQRLESLPPLSLFEEPSEYQPRTNQHAEKRLETDLLALATVSPQAALAKIKTLAAEHATRATWVWATLGESPLALAMGHLCEAADIIQTSGTPTTWDALAYDYATRGWQADRSVWQALAAARSSAATQAVTAAIRAIYLPWLEKFASLAQSLAATYPTTGPQHCRTLPVETGTVYLFADGLRLDLARSLETRLRTAGLASEITLTWDWSALPTVTATAKPAWQPLAAKLGGPLEGVGFQVKERHTGKALVQARFKALLPELGLTFLEANALGLPTGCAWTEYGSVDTYGHEQGAKLAWRVEEELAGLQQRIADLLHAGWAKVHVITDHGWLMLPGGLPKAELPKHLTASRWSRCALPDPDAQHGYPLTAWFWDAAEAVVLAPGVSCFVAGMEYAHGGLTVQEALIPSLTVTAQVGGGTKAVVLKDLKWLGLRLNVVLEGAQGLTVDLRRQVADAATSLAASPMTGAATGQKTSLLVADDETLGTDAWLVVIDATGQPLLKHPVVIGER
jgi:hypothetical protein